MTPPLPPNVLRPAPHHWQDDRDVPAGFGSASVELRDLLGLRRLGAHQERVPPGRRTAPLHAHWLEEEVFLVLSGTLTAREWDGEQAREYALHPGDLVAYPPATGIAHAFENRGPCEAVFLALSDDHPGEVCAYPDSGKTLLRPLGQVGVFGDVSGPADAEARVAAAAARARARVYAPLSDAHRPPHVVPAGSVPERDLGRAFGRRLSAAAGARRVMVNRDRLPPGGRTAPLHWHSGDEELVLVLSGTPTLRQQAGVLRAPGPRGANPPRFGDTPPETVVLSPGDLVYFGPHLPLAHHLLDESDADCALLVVGLDTPGDVALFPETGRVAPKALSRGGAFVPLPYWSGEGA